MTNPTSKATLQASLPTPTRLPPARWLQYTYLCSIGSLERCGAYYCLENGVAAICLQHNLRLLPYSLHEFHMHNLPMCVQQIRHPLLHQRSIHGMADCCLQRGMLLPPFDTQTVFQRPVPFLVHNRCSTRCSLPNSVPKTCCTPYPQQVQYLLLDRRPENGMADF